MQQPVKKIVIIGGGFAGINLAKKLQNSRYYEVTLVDRNNYNYFTPLIYQVATSFLEPTNISYPFRKFFRNKKSIHIRLGEFLKVEPATHTCYLNNGALIYDYLVFATGAATNYFGNENIMAHAIPMKTLNDALLMRNRLLQSLEQASITRDAATRKKLLTIVVAGGGPTGVEVAGMLGELRKNVIAKDYPELKGAGGDIYLVDGGNALLAQMSSQTHKDTLDALTKLNIKVILNTQVSNFLDGVVSLSDGQTIEAGNLIWAAGVTATVFDGIPVTSFGKGRRLITDAFNKVVSVEDIYAIGDTCLQTADVHFPNGHPQLAQPAIQQGRHLASNFEAMAKGEALKPFVYFDKGTMAIIGRNKAVVDLATPHWHIKGFVALLIWLFVHLVSLIAYRNRMKTLYNWITAYFTKDQSLRVILRPQS